ncbi:MAG: heparan-alpha-glucosaminide N-acetyltransferase domain-containing protein [Candidatus Helarchaeota archaeon]
MEKSINGLNKEKDPVKITRIKAMDTARGIATWLLMPAHFTHWYLRNFPNPSWATWLFRSILGTAFQYVFITLPGMAVVLQLYIGRQRGTNEEKLKISIFKRGLILIIIQFICNFVAYEPHYTWNWFILSYIGFSIILSYYFTKISKNIRIILMVIIIVISPFLKSFFFDFYISSGGFLIDPWSIEIFLFKMCFDINFAIFPYLALTIFGTLYADMLIEAFEGENKVKFIKNSLIIGGILILFYVFTLGLDFIFNFPHIMFFSVPTRQDVIYAFGVVMFVTGLLFLIQDFGKKNWKILKPFEVYGGISLTVFVTHFYIFAPIFNLIYNPYANLSVYSVFLICSFFWAVYWMYGVLWRRFQRKYSLEWLLRRLS